MWANSTKVLYKENVELSHIKGVIDPEICKCVETIYPLPKVNVTREKT